MSDMSNPTNADRSERAKTILDCYSRLPGMDYRDGEEMDYDTAVTDMLADLRHFCDRHAIDFDQCSTMAEIHHNEEVAEEAGEGFGGEEV